jgi:hypothetical protein
MRRQLAEWAQQAHDLSQQHAAGLIPVMGLAKTSPF